MEKRRKEWKGGKGEKWDRSNAQIKKKTTPIHKSLLAYRYHRYLGKEDLSFQMPTALVPTN